MITSGTFYAAGTEVFALMTRIIWRDDRQEM